MNKAVKRLATIGYEGLHIDDLVAALRGARVRVLIDVRELPLSRRKGFSKTALAQSLAAHGIGYRHLRDLGDPKAGRLAARAGDYAKFRKIYAAHLRSRRAQDALAEAIRVAKHDAACLLCYERNSSARFRSPAVCRRFGCVCCREEEATQMAAHLACMAREGSAKSRSVGHSVPA